MNSDFKILIVDDEVLIAEFLKDELSSLGYSNIDLAHNSKQAIGKLESFKPNVVLLDIWMNSEREGIEIAEVINAKFNIPFIFITSHSDREIVQQALVTQPAGYITKPFKKMDVFAAIHLVEKEVSKSNSSFLMVKDGHSEIKIPIEDILFAQSDDNYIQIITTQKKHLIRKSMEWMKENTPDNMFQRTHRSYLVNTSKITRITTKSVFIDDYEIPVSRGKKISF